MNEIFLIQLSTLNPIILNFDDDVSKGQRRVKINKLDVPGTSVLEILIAQMERKKNLRTQDKLLTWCLLISEIFIT